MAEFVNGVDVNGGGGGGGGGTSDGVTIQGDGSGGSPFAIKNLGVSTAKLSANAVTAAKIANGTITDVQVASANIDGLAAVASLRTLGTGAQQACAGNDARLTDTRTPADGSVTTAKVVDANITDAKLATAYLKADGSRALSAAWSTGAFDVTFGAKIIGGTIGPASGQQHTIPSVTSDTVALLAASQTFTNKTLTTPTINGATLSGTLSGAFTASGVATFTAAPVVSITDATTNAVTDCAVVTHMTSGTPASGIAAGVLFKAQNASGVAANAARIAGRLTTLTNAAESGCLDAWVNVAGTMTRAGFFGPDGGLVVGSGTALLGAPGIAIPNGEFVYARNTGNTGWVQLLRLNGTRVEFGTDSNPTMIRGDGLQVYSSNPNINFYCAGGAMSQWSTTVAQWGQNDASGTPSNFTHRGSDAVGTNIAGAVMTFRTPLGTGTGAVGILRIEGGQLQTSGSTAHSTVTLAEFSDTDTDGDTMFLLRVRKSGVETVERVTLVAAASVAASGRNFLSVS